MILGETCSYLFEVNIFLVATSIPIHTFIFFVMASTEAALNSLFGSFVFLTALRDTGRAIRARDEYHVGVG